MTTAHVAVQERAAAFRRGLEGALCAFGMQVDTPEDLDRWLAEPGVRLVVLTLPEAPECVHVELLVRRGGTVVALLPDPTVEAFGHALRHGATGAVDWHEDPDTMVAIVAAAAKGQTVLPAGVARAIGHRTPPCASPTVTEEELGWLAALAAGRTVVELADEAGYSERSMFRRLHDLYDKLGVQHRSAAVREAERRGLLTDEVPAPTV